MSRATIFPFFAALFLCALGVRAQSEGSDRFEEIDSIRQEILRFRGRLDALNVEGLDNERVLREVDELIAALEEPEEDAVAQPSVPAFQAVGRDIAYFRWDALEQAGLEALLAGLAAREQWSGLVMDLRFCAEGSWEALASVTGLFVDREVALVRRGDEAFTAVPGAGRWRRMPRVILINRETSGVAEALAATLHRENLAVLVGETTADDGAGPNWSFADGAGFEGVARPDIAVSMDLEDQRTARMMEASQSLSRALRGSRAFQDAVLENLSRLGPLGELEPTTGGADEGDRVVDAHLERAVDLIRATRLAMRKPGQTIRR